MLSQKRNRALKGQALWLVVMAGLAVAAVLVVCRPSVSERARPPRDLDTNNLLVPLNVVWAWGREQGGGLCDGTGMPGVRPTPVQVQNLSGVTAVAGGGGYSLALKFDGTVWACGFNASWAMGPTTPALRRCRS